MNIFCLGHPLWDSDGTILVDPPTIVAVGQALDSVNGTATDAPSTGLHPGQHLAQVIPFQNIALRSIRLCLQ